MMACHIFTIWEVICTDSSRQLLPIRTGLLDYQSQTAACQCLFCNIYFSSALSIAFYIDFCKTLIDHLIGVAIFVHHIRFVPHQYLPNVALLLSAETASIMASRDQVFPYNALALTYPQYNSFQSLTDTYILLYNPIDTLSNTHHILVSTPTDIMASLMSNEMNNYIVRSYRDVIVVTKIATRRTSKAQSIVMY